MLLDVKNINFSYDEEIPILNGVDFSLSAGEKIGIIGATGSGKTTFLKAITGLLDKVSGSITFDGKQISNEKDWRAIRRRIGVAFQFPENQLFEETVLLDVAFGLKNLTPGAHEDEAKAILSDLGMGEKFHGKNPFQLSSGEKRRVALAGILAVKPDALFLDEPTIGMDQSGIDKLEQQLTLLNEAKCALCIVSHNMDFIYRNVDRVVVIGDKKILFDGDKNELFCDEKLLSALTIQKPEILILAQELAAVHGFDVGSDISLDKLAVKVTKILSSDKN